MKQKSWNKAKRWLLWLGGGMIILCVAAGGFWYWINIPPQVNIPTPVMPKPNGFDYFQRAGAAFMEDRKGVDEVTDTEFVKDKQYPLAAKEDWLKQNAKAFQLLKEGLKYPALHPPVRSETYFPEYSKFRNLARALVVESHVRAARGDWSGAANSTLDDLEFSYDIPRGGPLIAGLAGEAVQVIALREMYQISPHLNAKTANQVAQRMEHLYAGRFPYFKTMQEEKWKGQAEDLEMMSKKFWRLRLVLSLSYPSGVIAMLQLMDRSYTPPSRLETAKEFLKYSKIFVMSKKTLMNNYTNALDATIANGRVSYEKMQPVSTSNDPLTNLLIPVFTNTRWNWVRMDAYNVLDMTMLALRAYRLEKSHYPANLKELVPQYLNKIPIDPFLDDAALHYKLQGQKYLLWSIGSDGVDNHGTPIINRVRSNSARYRVLDPDSKGDVVAGINLP